MENITINFVEPNLIFRRGFSLLLEASSTVKQVKSYGSVYEMRAEDLNLTDLLIFDTTGQRDYPGIEEIRAKFPELRFLVLSSKERFFENYLFAKTFQTDAFLTKNCPPDSLLAEVSKIAAKIKYGIEPNADPDQKLYNELFNTYPPFSFNPNYALELRYEGQKCNKISRFIDFSIAPLW